MQQGYETPVPTDIVYSSPTHVADIRRMEGNLHDQQLSFRIMHKRAVLRPLQLQPFGKA